MNARASFHKYWDTVDDELAAMAARPVLERMPRHCTEDWTLYALRMTSIGPVRLFGYLSIPTGDGPFPGLLEIPTYGSVNHVPDWHDRRRYVVLTPMHRGQRLADMTFAASYPGLLTLDLHDPERYIYRGIAADCLRAAEVLLSRPELDRDRVAVSGGDLAVITAARRPVFRALRLQGLVHYRAMEARSRTNAYPLEEFNDYIRYRPGTEDAVGHTLDFFNPALHAPAVRAAVATATGEPGTTTGIDWLAPILDALGGPVEHWPATHRGGIDRDRMDAWLAGQLGVEPASRFIKELQRW